MLTGHVKINEFQIVEYQATNEGTDEDGLTIWEVMVHGRSNRGDLYDMDFQVIDEAMSGPALVATIMTEVDARLP